MNKYRKKPVVIEAIQWDGTLSTFAGISLLDKRIRKTNDDGSITIPTLEGNMKADEGDWIIKGVKGEIYPCKPDIFAATYEPA